MASQKNWKNPDCQAGRVWAISKDNLAQTVNGVGMKEGDFAAAILQLSHEEKLALLKELRLMLAQAEARGPSPGRACDLPQRDAQTLQ